MDDLRYYQKDMVEQIESNWSSGIRSQCSQLPTGAGKSRIIRKIVENHAQNKKIIYVIAHRKNLVKQLSDELIGEGIQHGIISANTPHLNYRVQVCSLMSLANRIERLPQAEIIIIDEFHHAKSASYMKIINAWDDAKILGMTATPRRPDGKSLADITERLIVGPDPQTLIDQGYLSSFDYYAPDDADMGDVHKRMGDYVMSEAADRVDKRKITGSAIDHYREYADHTPAIAACISIDHCVHVEREFNDAGYKFKAIHSRLDDREISRAMLDLKNGYIDGLVNCDLISEGVDIPAVTTLIGLRPTQSEVIFLQQCGRVLRRAAGKDWAIILDHVGNHERHGLPNEARNWTLEPNAEIMRSIYKRCPRCQRGDVPRTARECPYCGFLWAERKGKGRQALPEEVEGRLVKIEGVELPERPGRAATYKIVASKAKTLADAKRITEALGYKPGFGYYVWSELQKKKRRTA